MHNRGLSLIASLALTFVAACGEQRERQMPTETGDTGLMTETGDTDGNGSFGNPPGGGGGTDITPPVTDSDHDGEDDSTDCEPYNDTAHHGAPELQGDNVDNDCDGVVDEAQDNSSATTWYLDADHDNVGGSTSILAVIDPGIDWVNVTGDCNDADAAMSPLLVEAPGDNKDNDCNPLTSDAVGSQYTHYPDADRDGYGVSTGAITDGNAAAPAGYSNVAGDCADGDPLVNPGRVETPGDGKDNDCNAATSDSVGSLPPCAAGESYVEVVWTAPSSPVYDIFLSGMVESGVNYFQPDYYTVDMADGDPIGAVITNTPTTVALEYQRCTADLSRWELSVKYRETVGGPWRFSCAGGTAPFAVLGTFAVTVDGVPHSAPTAVTNGMGGCEHEFFQ